MQGIEEVQKQRAELMLQKKYFEYIKDFIIKNQGIDDFVSPGAMGVKDQVFNGLLSELLDQQSERNELTMNLRKEKENPFLKTIDLKIENKKKLILENLRTLIEANAISLKEANDRIVALSDKGSALPKTQGKLFGYERLFKLNNELYTYLLTKRSETLISKAALMPDNEVLDKAHRRSAVLITPNTTKSFLLAFFLGLIIPILIIYVVDYFDDNINSIKDVEQLTELPVLGCVVHGKHDEIPTLDGQNSSIAESLRSIRANFQFVLEQKATHVILVTSSITNEGKSFVSSCLASSFALFEKKTVLLCFDLRKPLKHLIFENSNSGFGISTYLSGNCEVKDIIKPTNNKNLYVIFPGPLPPNPNELIASQRTEELFKQLKSEYEYIIVDTPPVGLIADSLLLTKLVDLNIFIVRHRRTSRNLLDHICNMYKKKNLHNLAIIVNDIPISKNRYGYDYGYYGYGYNYYYDNSKKNDSWIRKIISFKKG
jgi:tyrosine-protein kinase Etk/Wzc